MQKLLTGVLGAFFLFSLPLCAEVERTLSIIKPEAVAANRIGAIVEQFESNGFKVVGARRLSLSQADAASFYSVHRARPFYGELVAYMTSGPVFVMALEAEGAVQRNRDLMGATNPKDAKPGTLRARFGTDIQQNAVHGSDSLENATKEIAFFFAAHELG